MRALYLEEQRPDWSWVLIPHNIPVLPAMWTADLERVVPRFLLIIKGNIVSVNWPFFCPVGLAAVLTPKLIGEF